MATRPGRRTPAAATPPSDPLVVCVDGPMKNQWYTEPDWRERVASAAYMVERGQRRSPCLDYVRGPGGPVRHPDMATDGRPLQYRPKENA